MRHFFTAIVTAIEGVAIAVVSLAFLAVCGLLIWLFPLKMEPEVGQLIEVLAAAWGLAHSYPAQVVLEIPEELRFTVSLVPLGISAITAWLAMRVGLRLRVGIAVGSAILAAGALGFALASYVIIWASTGFDSRPLLETFLPATFWFIVPAWGALLYNKFWVLSDKTWIRGWARSIFHFIPRVLKIMSAAGLALVSLGALAVSITLLTSYPEVMRLSQMLQLDLLGVVILFLLQLAFLPVFVIWAIAWFSGVGFSIGISTIVSPFELLLGPLPSVPVLGALPSSWGSWGFIAVIITSLLLLAVGAIYGELPEFRAPKALTTLAVLLVASALLGLIMAGLAGLASGALGPGRMEVVGIEAWVFGGVIALETFVGLTAGVFLRRSRQQMIVEKTEHQKTDIRIADPLNQETKPWFRTGKKETSLIAELSEEELIEEYSWELMQAEKSVEENGID